jgi:histone H3/H4
MKEEGYRLRFKESYKGDDFEFEGDEDDDDDKDDDDDGWAKETLLHAHYRRLEEIEVAQEDTRFGFEIISFESFVRATCHDMGMDCTFTAEAMEVLQTCTEAHVINVISDAYCAVSRVNQSPVLTSKDIRADRRHTGNPSYHPWGW